MKYIIRSARPCRWLGAGAALFLAITIPSSPVSAQEETKPPATGEAGAESESESAPGAIAIIQRAIEAMGGEEAIESIESARYTLETEHEGDVTVRKALVISPDLYLVEEEGRIGLSEMGFDGSIGWSLTVHSNTYMCTVTLASRVRAQQDVDLWLGFTAPHRQMLILRERAREAEHARAMGRVEFNERTCEKVLIAHAGGEQTIVFFDVETGLLAGIETVRPRGGWTIRMTNVYEDWRQCGPILLFRTWRQQDNMRKGEATTTIADFEFNAGSRRDIQPPVGAIEVIRVGLLRLAEDDRPPLLTREDIGLMALEEVRHALVEVARLRKEYRQREQMGEGDEAIVAWLKWEFHWLMERMQAPQERAPE